MIVMGHRIEHRVVGTQHVFTSPDLPGLFVAHRDRGQAEADVPAVIEMLRLMAFYREADVLRLLEDCGCRFEWRPVPSRYGLDNARRDALHHAESGWLDADVVDLILADRWIWTEPPRLKRHAYAISE